MSDPQIVFAVIKLCLLEQVAGHSLSFREFSAGYVAVAFVHLALHHVFVKVSNSRCRFLMSEGRHACNPGNYFTYRVDGLFDNPTPLRDPKDTVAARPLARTSIR
jgi:hypothetical protein